MQFPVNLIKPPMAMMNAEIVPLKAEIISVSDVPGFKDILNASINPPDVLAGRVPDNAPENIYARIYVDGEMVGEVYKGGSCMMTNAAAARVGKLADGAGLSLAKIRTAQIADAMNGEIRLMNEFAPAQTSAKPAVKAAPVIADPRSLFMTKQAK